MSIYKRKSGKWAVMIDADDPSPYRIVEPLHEAKNGAPNTNRQGIQVRGGSRQGTHTPQKGR